MVGYCNVVYPQCAIFPKGNAEFKNIRAVLGSITHRYLRPCAVPGTISPNSPPFTINPCIAGQLGRLLHIEHCIIIPWHIDVLNPSGNSKDFFCRKQGYPVGNTEVKRGVGRVFEHHFQSSGRAVSAVYFLGNGIFGPTRDVFIKIPSGEAVGCRDKSGKTGIRHRRSLRETAAEKQPRNSQQKQNFLNC